MPRHTSSLRPATPKAERTLRQRQTARRVKRMAIAASLKPARKTA